MPSLLKSCFLIFVLMTFIFLPEGLYANDGGSNELSTEFTYTDEDLTQLKSVKPSTTVLSIHDLAKWDDTLYSLTGNPLQDGGGNRLFAYLYVAQRDAAYLSYNIHGKFLGNLDPLTLKIIHLFVPEYQHSQSMETDVYSRELTDVVFKKIEERYKNEESHLVLYPTKSGSQYWSETPPIIGQRIGSCETWLIGPVQDYRLPPPPPFHSIIWAYGINQIITDQKHLTETDIDRINFWAGLQGPKSGNWHAIANDYMLSLQPKLSLKNFLFIRSIYAMGLVDSLIATFDSKYTYWVIRPHMRDPQLKILISVPKHPSYPSGHSTCSGTASTLLSYFFPEKTEKWRALAIEAGNSRIWAGLHYMLDNEDGLILGERVGKATIAASQVE